MTIIDEVFEEFERAFTMHCAKHEGLLPSRTECNVLKFAAGLVVDRLTVSGLSEMAIRNYFCTRTNPMRSFRVAKISTFNWAIEVSLPADDEISKADGIKERWWMVSGDTYTSHENAERGIRELAERLGLGKRFQVQSPGNHTQYAGKTWGYVTLSKLSMMWNGESENGLEG